MSIVSLLARIGSSDPIEPFTSIEPLIEGFEFSKFGRATAKFDPKDLETLNAKILHVTDYDAVKDRLPEGVNEAIWNVARTNIKHLDDVSEWLTIINGPITPIIEDADFIAKASAFIAGWPIGTRQHGKHGQRLLKNKPVPKVKCCLCHYVKRSRAWGMARKWEHCCH